MGLRASQLRAASWARAREPWGRQRPRGRVRRGARRRKVERQEPCGSSQQPRGRCTRAWPRGRPHGRTGAAARPSGRRAASKGRCADVAERGAPLRATRCAAAARRRPRPRAPTRAPHAAELDGRARHEQHDHGAQLLAAGSKDLVGGGHEHGVALADDGPQVGVHLAHVVLHGRHDFLQQLRGRRARERGQLLLRRGRRRRVSVLGSSNSRRHKSGVSASGLGAPARRRPGCAAAACRHYMLLHLAPALGPAAEAAARSTNDLHGDAAGVCL